MAKIYCINGPNLNLLGSREPERYGHASYTELCDSLLNQASALDDELSIHQSNHEGELVDMIQAAGKDGAMIIINPAAYTHTSVAIRDALLAIAVPFIEVHISNVYAREAYRQQSFLSDIALGVITGLGTMGYSFALDAAHRFINQK